MATKASDLNKAMNDWIENKWNPAPSIHVDGLENDERALTPSVQQYKPVNNDTPSYNTRTNAPINQPTQQPQSNIFQKLFNAIYHANDNPDDPIVDNTNYSNVQNMNSSDLKKFISDNPNMPQSQYNKLISMQTDKENSEAIDNIKNPLLKGLASIVFAPSKQTPFLNRVKSTGVNTITGGAANLTQTDTGSGAKNFVADMLGSGLGFVAPQPGAAQSLGNVLDQTIGQPVANKLGFLGNSTPARYAQSALKTGAEFAGLNAVESGLQGKNIQDVGKATGEGLLQGALFGAGGKLLGDIAPKIKNAALPDWKTTYRDGVNINNPSGKLGPIKPNEIPNIMSNELPVTPLLENNLKPPTDNVKPSIGATDRTQMQTAVVTGKNNSSLKDKFGNFLKTAKTELYDTNAPLANVDTSTYRTATNAKKASGTVDYILNDKLVDRQGNPLGEGLKSIASDIPKNQEKEFFNYILQKHNIDRAANDKSIDSSFSSDQSAKAVNLIEQKYPDFKAVGDRLTGFINNFMGEWGNKSGLINDDLWKSLQDTYKNYIPTNRSFNELEKGFSKTNGKGFVDQSKPISRATGSDRDVINPIENIANIVNRTVRTARYNQVGQDLLNAIRNNPEKMAKDAQIIPEGETINPNVNNVVSVLENGNPVNIQINNKGLLESLQGVNKSLDFTKLENVVGAANKGFKSLITTKNPVFGLRNMARDIPTAYVYGNEHNPLKFGANYLGAMKDLITNSPAAQQYKALGGEGANFFSRDKTYKTANDLMGRNLVTDKGTGEIIGSKNPNIFSSLGKKINNGIETFNNVIESTPRLAEFKSTLNKGGNVQDALYNSGEITTNFSRSGKSIKRLDNSVPYLNASVQGLGKFMEQATKHPLATLAKGTLSVTAPSVAISMLNQNNPNYNKLDNRTKDTNFLFPNPSGPKDANGNPETFIKIPKSRELGAIFGDLAERAIRQGQGDNEAFKGLGNTISTSFAPVNPLESNIYSPIVTNLPSNKDFAGRTIVPDSMKDLSPKYQFDENTSNMAKSLGELTNLSPKQIDYVIKSYTGVLGQLSQNATTPSKYTSNSAANIFMPVTGQFKSDVLYNNQDLQNFYDNVQKAKTAAADKNFVDNVDSKTVTDEEGISNGYTRALKEISSLSKEAAKASREGDEAGARQARAEIIQIAQDANSGTFPLTKTQSKQSTPNIFKKK